MIPDRVLWFFSAIYFKGIMIQYLSSCRDSNFLPLRQSKKNSTGFQVSILCFLDKIYKSVYGIISNKKGTDSIHYELENIIEDR